MLDFGPDLGPDLGPDRTSLFAVPAGAAAGNGGTIPLAVSSSKILSLLDVIQGSFYTAEDAARLAALGTMTNLLVGGDGSAGNTEYGAGNGAFIVSAYPIIQAMLAAAQPNLISKSIYTAFFSWLDTYFANNTSGLTFGGKAAVTLDLYASYQNAQLRNSFLVGPGVAYLYFLYRVSSAASLLTPTNVFAPVTQLGTGAVGAGAAIAYTNQASIRTANDTVNLLQGYTPAPGASVQVTTAVNGTLTITVTASGQDKNGNAVTNRLWTAVLDNLAAEAPPVALTPNIAGDRLSQITSIAGAGSATAGAFTLTSTFERAIPTPAAPVAAGGTLRFIAFEKPAGVVNGANTVFTSQFAPAGGIAVYLNGQQQDPVSAAQGGLGQVSPSGSTATFAAAPVVGDAVRFSYFTAN